MYTGMMLALAVVLVGLNGMFVAAEFAFVKVRKTRLELLSAKGSKAAKSALYGLSRLDAYLSVTQLGITLASLGLGWIGEPAVARLLRPLFELSPLDNPSLIKTASFIVSFTLITLAHVIFGELAPKSLSIQKTEAVCLALARPMRFFYVLSLPVVSVMNGISNLVLRLAGLSKATESEQSHSPEELRLLILDSSLRGGMNRDEGRMLDNIFSFYQKSARDIMQHRMDVCLLNVSAEKKDVVKLVKKSGYTRYPVYEDNPDNLIGFIHVRDLLLQDDVGSLRDILRAPFYAPENLPLEKLLETMREARQQFCVLMDEYGDWQGVCSMEDIVEAIVGDIQDEFDNEAPDVITEADGTLSVSGDLSLDDLAEHISLDCGPDMDMYKILAAHFIEKLGRIPREGDSIDMCGKHFIVSRMDRNRVRRVRVEKGK